ncbi:MAG: hypothetical protein AAF694_26915 [Bacteroidota bacterium]
MSYTKIYSATPLATYSPYFELKQEHFPFFTKNNSIQISNIWVKQVDALNNDLVDRSELVSQATGSLPLNLSLNLGEADFEKELYVLVSYNI